MHAALQYIWHWLTAVNEHSLHSPFLFNLFTKTIKIQPENDLFPAIEKLRVELISSKEKIAVQQLGAESKVNNQQIRPVSAVAKSGLSSARFSKILYALINEYNYQNIIELGTSFGINTLYLAANKDSNITTFEGCPNTARIAAHNFNTLNAKNIDLIEGDINDTLTTFCAGYKNKIDLAFIDANHQYAPTINYFHQLAKKCHENSLIIIDDIYWSKDMTKAWEQIKDDPQVTSTIDLYKAGIVLFRPELSKSRYKLMF